MSFRYGEEDCPKPISHAEVVTSPADITITNGEVATIGFPCHYLIPRDDKLEPKKSHIEIWTKCYYWDIEHRMCFRNTGKPWSSEMCRTCPNFINWEDVTPIHLREEYGDNVQVLITFSKKDDGSLLVPGLTADVEIDPKPYDYVVRSTFKANCPSAQNEPQHTRFSLIIKSNDDKMKSVLAVGKICILPSLLP